MQALLKCTHLPHTREGKADFKLDGNGRHSPFLPTVDPGKYITWVDEVENVHHQFERIISEPKGDRYLLFKGLSI